MAFHALQCLTVLQMAFVTTHDGVGAGELLRILPGTGMTGNAGRTNFLQSGQVLHLRGMGIMAGGAIVDGKMRLIIRCVTIGTGRHGAVLAVATGAADLLMRATGFGDERARRLVAGAAQGCTDLRIKADGRRSMGSMALLAIVPSHRLGVRLVALQAVGQLAVLGMAVDAILLAMGVGNPVHLHLDLGMASDAGRHDVLHFCQRLIQRSVRRMAVVAVFEGKVRIFFRHMTEGTGRRCALLLRRVFAVTAKAADFFLVRLAGRL